MRLLACLIVAPQRGYDEPATLSYAISSFCPTSADGLQLRGKGKFCRCGASMNGDHPAAIRALHDLCVGIVSERLGAQSPSRRSPSLETTGSPGTSGALFWCSYNWVFSAFSQ